MKADRIPVLEEVSALGDDIRSPGFRPVLRPRSAPRSVPTEISRIRARLTLPLSDESTTKTQSLSRRWTSASSGTRIVSSVEASNRTVTRAPRRRVASALAVSDLPSSSLIPSTVVPGLTVTGFGTTSTG